MNQNTLEGGGQLHSDNQGTVKTKSVFSRLIAGLIASVMALAGLVAIGPAAYAQTPGISITALHNNSPISQGQVFQPGDNLTLRVQYDRAVDSASPVVVDLPQGVTFDDASLEVPSGNTAIEDISHVNGSVHISFYEPSDWTVDQGVWDLNFAFNPVDETGSQNLEWRIDGEPTSFEVIVRTPGDEQADVSNSLNKSASGNMYDQFVSIEDGQVQISESVLNHEIRYTLTVHTDGDTDRSDFTIQDQLSEYLEYNNDFSATLTTWDDDGWNRDVDENFEFSPTVDGNSFAGTVNLPSPSELTINYTASLTENGLEAMRAELQSQYDDLDGGYGGIGYTLANEVTFGGSEEREADVEIGLLIPEPAPAPGPDANSAFSKGATPGQQNVEPAEDGTLDPAAEVTYTFDADLSQWDGQAAEGYENHEDFVLERNVVISDELPSQASWNTGADDFITVDGFELEEATGFDGDAAEFEADEFVGNYAVVGQNLFINVGQDADTDATITVKALVNTVDELDNWTNDSGFTIYQLDNNASFDYSTEDDPYRDSARVELVDRGDTSDGVNIPAVFSKDAPQTDGLEYVDLGEAVTIDYTFVVNAWGNESVDVTNSYIVDYRDPNLFDFSDLEEIQSNVSGEYAHWIQLGPEHFDLSLTDDGNLRIELSETGVELVGDDVDNRLEINLPLTTVEFDSRQTIEIENDATLYGSDDDALYWSETSSEASSFGDEAEVRKSIRDAANQEWTQNLRVEIGEDRELVQDEYVYNLAFIPHGNYSAVTISPVHDELPDELEFLGFVTDENVDTGADPVDGPVDIGGNLEAVYDEDTHTVTVQQKEGTLLTQEPNISANVLTRVIEFEEDVPVVNIFGNSPTTFTPSDGYPLSIAKVDSEDEEVVINDPESRFNILDEDDNVVIEDAFVVDGQLRVTNDEGETTGLVVREPGTYYVEEVVAPAGYELSTDRIRVTVDEDGSSDQVTFPNVPAEEPPTPEIDVIKNDEGDDVHQVQAGEHDVSVTITNDGNEALENFEFTDTTEDGQDVVWDEEDLAALEELILEPGESFTVNGTVQVAAGETHRDNVVVTADGVISGEPVEDEDPTTYEADPTYAIGDYVWIDENGNGIQDEGETPLEDVTVVLYDGEGNELDRTVTDEHGRYLFDNLPAGDYEVGFELTEEQAALYEFTDPTRGDDPAQDSNAGERGRTGVFTLGPDSPLVSDEDYEYASVSASEGIDPTWDAGVVLIPEEVETPPLADPTDPRDPADPTEPADPAGPGSDTPEGDDEGPGGTLPMTGAHLALLLTAAGLILLVIGGLLYARHRKGINA